MALDGMMDPDQINHHWLAHLNKIGKRQYDTETEEVKELVKKEIERVMAQKREMENALAGEGNDAERLKHLQRSEQLIFLAPSIKRLH